MRAAILGSQIRDDVAEAMRSLSRALEIDPRLAAAQALLGMAHSLNYRNGWSDDPERERELADALTRRAVEMDPEDAMTQFARGVAQLWAGDLDGAMASARRSRALAPNFTHNLGVIANCLIYSGQPGAALPLIDEAPRREPALAGLYLHFLGHASFHLAAYDEAEAALRRRLALSPKSDSSRLLLAATLGHLGRHREAREVWQELLAMYPGFSVAQRQRTMPYRNPADFAQIVEGLDKAGIVHDVARPAGGASTS